MTIVDNADLKLSLTILADEEVDLVALLREVAKEIKRGSLAGNGGGCIGSYYYSVDEQTRDAQQRTAPDRSAIELLRVIRNAGDVEMSDFSNEFWQEVDAVLKTAGGG